jgi:hypothetical protein
MRGRQTISCASRPDRYVYPLHLFTQASAASLSSSIEFFFFLCEGETGEKPCHDWALRCAEDGQQRPHLGVVAQSVDAVVPGHATSGGGNRPAQR